MPPQRRWWNGRPPLTARFDRTHGLGVGLTGFWTFGEGGGTPYNLLRPIVTNLGGATWATNRHGLAVRMNAQSDYIALGTIAQLFPSATDATILMRVRRTGLWDSYFEGAEPCIFGQYNNTINERILGMLPHHGSNGSFWDWGGDVSGTSRLYMIGELLGNYGDDLLVLTVGPRGMEMWRNGRLVASQAGASSRVQTNDSQDFRLGDTVGNNASAVEYSLAAIWSRQLSTVEVVEVSDDPLALFRPPTKAPLLGRFTPPDQIAAPIGDTDPGTWTDQGGGTSTIYQSIDEAITAVSDADYIQSVAAPSAEVYETGLDTVTDPAVSTGHVVFVRAHVDSVVGGVTTLTTELRQGTSALSTPATWNDALTASAQTFEHTLSGAQADAITNYAALRLRFTTTQVAGGTGQATFFGSGTAAFTATSGATMAPGLPTGWAAGDIHILIASRGDNTAMTSLSGWTQLSATNSTAAFRTEVWWRRAVGGDTAPTVTFGTGTVVRGARIYGVRNALSSGSPFDTGTGAPTALANAASATISFTNLTTTEDGCLALALAGYEDDPSTRSTMTNWTQPTGPVSTSTLGNDLSLSVQYREMATAGSVGATTQTASGGSFANSPNVGVVLAIRSEPPANASRTRITWTQLAVPATSGTLLTVGIGGTLGMAGVLVKQNRKVLAGTLSMAGVLVKQGRRALAGTVGMVGALAKRNNKPLAATLGAAGTLTAAKLKLVGLAGTLGSAGALVKQGRRAVAGTLGSAGALAKQGRQSLAGVLGMTGAQQSAYATEVLGTTGLCAYWPLEETSGGVCNSLLGSYPATADVALDPATAVVVGGGPSQHFDGTQGLATGAMGEVWRTKSAISVEGWVRLPSGVIGGHHAALTSIRNDSNEDFYVLLLQGQDELEVRLRVNSGTGGDLTPTITLDGGVHHFVSAYDSTTGVHEFYWDGALLTTGSSRSGMPDRGTDAGVFRIGIDANANHWEGDLGHVALYDVALSSGTVATHYSAGSGAGLMIPVAVAGVLGTAGALVKQGRRTLVGTLSAAGALVKQNRRALAATLGMAGALAKQGRRVLAGTLGSAGALATVKTKVVALAGTLGSAGALVKQNRRVFAGALGAAGALLKQGRRALAGALGLSGATVATIPGDLPFRDDFTGAISGEWDERDSSGALSVLNNRAFFEYDGTQDDWLDPALVSPAATRADMAGLTALVRLTNRMDTAKGFKLSLSPSAADPDAAGSASITLEYPDLTVPSVDEPASWKRQRSKDLLLTVVKRESGGWMQLVSEGKAGGEWPVFPEAAVIGLSSSESDATLYAHLAARRGRAHVDYAAILAASSLPTAMTTRFGAALASEASGTRTAGTSNLISMASTARIVEATLTRGANDDTRAVLCFRGQNATYALCWKFKAEFDRVSLHSPGGLVDQTGAVSVAAGVPTTLRVVDFGDRIDCYVNGVRWLTANSTLNAANTRSGTACDTGGSLSVTVSEFSAWGNVTLNDDFGPFPKVPDAVGSAIVTETFTDTNGTSLPTHDADWAVAGGMGTFDIQSNKARITTAGTNGIATRNAATVNHAARATINLPADVSTYPVDVYPAVVARFTDANNFIQARLLWQDGPSPEIEVWEYVAGAGELIAYVNLTDTVVSAGDYTVTLAAQNAEVTAYLNGEVVAQGTTTVLTGTRAGIGVFDNNPAGQPTWDDFSIFQTNPRVSLTGTLGLAGALVKKGNKALAATLSAAGALRKQTTRALAATLGMTGALATAKLKLVALAGTLGMSGAVVKRGYKVLAGTLAAAGALVKQNRRVFAGTLGSVGAIVKRTSRAIAGALGASGDVVADAGANLFPVAVAGTLGATGAIRRQIGKTLTGTLGAAGALVKRINRGLAGVLAALGALVREPRRRVGGAVGMTGAVATTKTRTAALTGTLGSTGSLTKTLTRGPAVGGALGFGGGDVAIVLILTPPPPPVEFGLPAETGIGQATLVGETPYVEFAPLGPLTVTEAGLIMADVPPEAGGAPESGAPEFRLRG